jgi:hypothetical protein
MSIKQYLTEKKYSFSVYKIEQNGKLSNRENLGHDELDPYMNKVRGKFAKIRVVRDDGKWLEYDDDGTDWKQVKQGKK